MAVPRDDLDQKLSGISDDEAVRLQLLEVSAAAAGIGTFDWNLISGILKWDEPLKELFGYAPDEFDDSIDAFNNRLHPDDVGRVTAELKAAIESRGEFQSQYRVVYPDGTIIYVGARGRVLTDESGKAVRLLGAAWDNTVKANAEAEAARALESMATPYFSIGEDFEFVYVNSAAEKLMGLVRTEVEGKSIFDLFPSMLGTDFETNYRRTMETGETTAFDAYYPEPLDAWFEVRALRENHGIAVYALDITSRMLAQKELEAAARRAHLLSRITEELSGTLNYDEAARRLINLAVPELAEWGIVNLIDDEAQAARRGLRFVAAHHSDSAQQETLEAYASLRLEAMQDDDIIVRALASGEVQKIEIGASSAVQAMLRQGNAQKMMARLNPESVLVVPLMGPNGPVGMLSLANTKSRGAFSDADIVTVGHVGARAGLILENARLYRQQRTLAEGLQRSLLTEPAEPDHVEVIVRYEPASNAAQVGGDWYDSFLQPGGATVLVIGDVIGHDSVAASTMGQLRSIVRTLGAVGNDSPAKILSKTDDVMETLLVNTTATAIVARLEQTEDEVREGTTRLRWSNAGHPPPIAIHPNGNVELLDPADSELLLGVAPGVSRTENVAKLDRDAIVLMFTDGLIERRGQSLEDGLRILCDELAQIDPSHVGAFCDEVLRRMLLDNQEDDVALLAVKLHSQDKPRPDEAGPNRIPPNVERAPEIFREAP